MGKKNLKSSEELASPYRNYTMVDVQIIPMWRIKSSSVPSNEGEGALKALIVRNKLKIIGEHIEIKSRQATK